MIKSSLLMLAAVMTLSACVTPRIEERIITETEIRTITIPPHLLVCQGPVYLTEEQLEKLQYQSQIDASIHVPNAERLEECFINTQKIIQLQEDIKKDETVDE